MNFYIVYILVDEKYLAYRMHTIRMLPFKLFLKYVNVVGIFKK